jgi:choice-of-anchor B domain-containing protein
LTYPGKTCANICGYVDSVGNEYALVGSSEGLSIVDVTDPTNPVSVYQHVGPANAQSEWQEIKVSGKYAYVTTEAGGGLQIFNLSTLPNATGIVMRSWTGDGAIAGLLTKVHALHIDGNFVYLYGSTLFSGGAVVADISDHWNPTYVGKYSVGAGNAAYLHDGYVRNDTLYGGHIYAGYFSVVDFRNKSNPIELANQNTPSNFTHNTWLSTNSKVLYTTDEVNNSYLTAYDISDLSNITELDRIQSNPGSQSIVHNTHIIRVAGNDYAVTSWYKDGFTIVDGGRPQNLVQVGNFDTYAGSGGGFNGTWGVYPFLPSGNIIVSNIEDGLFVYTPTYVRACYLEGTVNDSVCGVQLNGVHVTVTSVGINDSTNLSGTYKTGTAIPGTYTVTFSKSGYITKTISGIVLSPGVVNNLNVQLAPFNTVNLSGLIKDAATTNPIDGVLFNIYDNFNTYDFISDINGQFNSCNVVAATDYDFNYGKWGYVSQCASGQTISPSSNALDYTLVKGYYDDFTFNFGWTVSGNATTGAWTRAVPVGTVNGSAQSNPGVDVSSDCSNIAYVTGNGGGSAGTDDVDNGTTILTSPVFDLSTYIQPYVNFSRWFYNGGGSGAPNDTLSISLDNGLTTVLIDTAMATSLGSSTWVNKTFKVSNFITPTATMKLIVKTGDVASSGHIVEAGLDKFFVSESPSGIIENKENNISLNAFPNPSTSEISITYDLKNLHSLAVMNVVDITGRIIEKISIGQASGTIVLNKLTAGIYFINITNGSEVSTPVKIIKMK